jgi:serine phosphatase RsbU (regulator of sigma subunit)
VLVLYTDGVSEARRADGAFFDEENIRRIIGSAPQDASADAIADGLVAAALSFQDDDARDDIAVLAVRAIGR